MEAKSYRTIKIEMTEYETQELFNAIMPIATDKIETPNYIHNSVQTLYKHLKDLGFKYIGD